jgi:hypothetical protein
MAPQYLPGEPSTQSRPPVYAAQDVPSRQAPHTFQGPEWVRRAREDMSGQSTSRRSLPDNPPIHLHLFPRRSRFGGDQPFIPNNRQLTQPENLRRTSDSLRQNQEHLQEPKCNAAGYSSVNTNIKRPRLHTISHQARPNCKRNCDRVYHSPQTEAVDFAKAEKPLADAIARRQYVMGLLKSWQYDVEISDNNLSSLVIPVKSNSTVK